jgi:hypothetical protein
MRPAHAPAVRLATILCILLAAKVASAACPDKRASCVLHEEGVALFLEKNYEEAAKKFAAAIAAEPTARSYLGYAQAVEALNQIALAYDTMVAAQRLSAAEVQANPKDAEVSSRQERIKYKLGELRAKIGFVWLRVPPGVPPQRVVAVKREGEGDLAQPLTQWTAVSPGRQVLIAQIDDGTKLEVVAEVAAGSQGVVVIPIRGGNPNPNRNPGFQPNPGGGRPLAQLYVPAPKIVTPDYSAYFSVGLSILVGDPERDNQSAGGSSGGGSGFTVLYEKKLASSMGLTTRAEYMFHSEKEDFNNNINVSGSEALFLVGARTFGSKTLHGRAGVGVSLYSESVKNNFGVDLDTGFTRAYGVFELGGGLNLGRVRFQMGVLFATGPGDPDIPSLGTRFMGTFAIDLYRKAEPLPKPPPVPSGPPTAPPTGGALGSR